MTTDYRTSKGCSLTLEEREFLREMAEQTPRSGCIVNIGVCYGASLHCLRAGAPEATLYGIDLNNSRLIGDPGAILITGNSNDPSHLPGVAIDLLFVDGAHDFKTVLYDLTIWAERVQLGGVLICHDYYVHKSDVKQAVGFWLRHVTSGAWEELQPAHSIFALRRLPCE